MDTQEVRWSLGIQTSWEIIEEGYCYVVKTAVEWLADISICF